MEEKMFKRFNREQSYRKQSRGGQDNEESKSNDPSSHGDDPISSDDYFIVKNPLVLLVCASDYEGGWDNLEGVRTDYKILHKLFSEYYGWAVDSIHQNVTKKAILDFMDYHKATIITDKNPCKYSLVFLSWTPSPFASSLFFGCLFNVGHCSLMRAVRHVSSWTRCQTCAPLSFSLISLPLTLPPCPSRCSSPFDTSRPSNNDEDSATSVQHAMFVCSLEVLHLLLYVVFFFVVGLRQGAKCVFCVGNAPLSLPPSLELGLVACSSLFWRRHFPFFSTHSSRSLRWFNRSHVWTRYYGSICCLGRPGML